MTKFTRTQELYLINRGLFSLLNEIIKPVHKVKHVVKKPTHPKWTTARRKKFAITMKKKWAAKKTAQ